MPLAMMVIVIILITVAYLHFAKGQATTPAAAPAARQGMASSNASPSLGPWKHITTRAEDPAALSLTELFPSRYAADGTVIRAIQQAGRNCPGMVVGNRLQAVLRKAGLHPGDAGKLSVRWAEDHGHHRGTEPGQRDRR